MNTTGLLAGIALPQQFERLCERHEFRPHCTPTLDGRVAFISCDEPNSHLAFGEGITVLVRGYATLPTASPAPNNQAANSHPEFANFVKQRYEAKQDCVLDDCDGSFSVVVLDATRSRLLTYRNIANNRFTYIAETPELKIIASNLASLTRSLPEVASNDAALPSYFLFRFSPGRNTLLKNVRRLLPGQSLTIEQDKIAVHQSQTLQDLTTPTAITHTDAVEQVGELFARIHSDIAALDPHAATLLSGGVDSCTLHAHWMKFATIPTGRASSFSITTDSPETQGDTQYALSAAKFFGTQHETVETSGAYLDYLIAGIRATGEPPNHVQGVFYRELAREMRGKGVTGGLNGEGADCLFGTPMTDVIRRAQRTMSLMPSNALRYAFVKLADWAQKPYWQQAFKVAMLLDNPSSREHPVNVGSVWTNYLSLDACFGAASTDAALAERRSLLDLYRVAADPLNQYHEQTMLGEVVDSATLWTSVFHEQGVDMICPFLDSRMIKFVLSLPRDVRFQYKKPKQVLKDALLKFMPREMVFRQKLAFGQPIFAWMKQGGQLRDRIEAIDANKYSFLPAEVLDAEKKHPSWFLFSLLCYDIWHEEFIASR